MQSEIAVESDSVWLHFLFWGLTEAMAVACAVEEKETSLLWGADCSTSILWTAVCTLSTTGTPLCGLSLRELSSCFELTRPHIRSHYVLGVEEAQISNYQKADLEPFNCRSWTQKGVNRFLFLSQSLDGTISWDLHRIALVRLHFNCHLGPH